MLSKILQILFQTLENDTKCLEKLIMQVSKFKNYNNLRQKPCLLCCDGFVVCPHKFSVSFSPYRYPERRCCMLLVIAFTFVRRVET